MCLTGTGHRQDEGETRATLRLVHHGNLARVRLDQLPGDGQAQPRASTGAGARPITPVEPLEDMGEVVRGDTRSGVGHGKGQSALPRQRQQSSRKWLRGEGPLMAELMEGHVAIPGGHHQVSRPFQVSLHHPYDLPFIFHNQNLGREPLSNPLRRSELHATNFSPQAPADGCPSPGLAACTCDADTDVQDRLAEQAGGVRPTSGKSACAGRFQPAYTGFAAVAAT